MHKRRLGAKTLSSDNPCCGPIDVRQTLLLESPLPNTRIRNDSALTSRLQSSQNHLHISAYSTHVRHKNRIHASLALQSILHNYLTALYCCLSARRSSASFPFSCFRMTVDAGRLTRAPK